jgi:translation initiation factor 3 subunit C
MSRFFRGGDDSSSESSTDEEELYSTSEEEEEEEQEEQESSEEEDEEEEESSEDEAGPQKKGLSRFLVDQAESETEESDLEGATKVKSAKDKRFDELEATITAIQNGQKINDWGSIANGIIPSVLQRLCWRGS